MIAPTCDNALLIDSNIGQLGRIITRLARKLGAVLGVLGVLAGGVTADEFSLPDRSKVAASDLTSGAPHDDIGDREAGWPDRPTMAQTETSTPSKAGSWEEAIRLADPTLIVVSAR
ncbi:MAG TPA: hypothetical protein VMA53_07015 [Stellaceae bacterium]|nr:hypothetical protein [Stellaceae bacterium]